MIRRRLASVQSECSQPLHWPVKAFGKPPQPDGPHQLCAEDRNSNPENSRLLAGMWKDFIKPEMRTITEGAFLAMHIPRNGRVFDACLGIGVTAMHLVREGHQVIGNEIDVHFKRAASKNAQAANLDFQITSYDWKELDRFTQRLGLFDAVCCLGNSLTYLFDKEDRHKALKNFLKLLKPGGRLIIDTRNYQYMLDERESILKNPGSFRYSGKCTYCGTDKVRARPVRIDDNLVVMEYSHLETGEKAELYLYPFKNGEMESLLCEAGFSTIEVFSDYKPGFNPKADFFQLVCTK